MKIDKRPPLDVTVNLPPGHPIMPSGRPLPDVCTTEDVIEYLRLGASDNPGGRNKLRALQRLRETGWLPGFRSGKNIMFTRDAVVECRKQMERERAS